MIPGALLIGISFKSKLTTFGDFSAGSNVSKMNLLFGNHLVSSNPAVENILITL